jgi:hypothetical protein
MWNSYITFEQNLDLCPFVKRYIDLSSIARSPSTYGPLHRVIGQLTETGGSSLNESSTCSPIGLPLEYPIGERLYVRVYVNQVLEIHYKYICVLDYLRKHAMFSWIANLKATRKTPVRYPLEIQQTRGHSIDSLSPGRKLWTALANVIGQLARKERMAIMRGKNATVLRGL